MIKELRCYFMYSYSDPESGGIACLAYKINNAKKILLKENPVDWDFTDLRFKWIRHIRFHQIPKDHQVEGHILGIKEGYRCGAYADANGDACAYCGDVECDGCAVYDELKNEEAAQKADEAYWRSK